MASIKNSEKYLENNFGPKKIWNDLSGENAYVLWGSSFFFSVEAFNFLNIMKMRLNMTNSVFREV